MPAPRRRQVTGPAHHGLAAIDFGTTSSTVTLRDEFYPQSAEPLPEAQLATLREELAKLLETAPGGADGDLRRAWAAVVEQVAVEVLRQPTAGRSALVAAIRADAIEETAHVHACFRALERRRRDCPTDLARWLALRLHRCFDVALTVPPVKHLQLHQVVVDRPFDEEIASRLEVTSTDPLTARLGRSRLKSDGDQEILVVDGLKHYLGRPAHRFRLNDGRHVDVDTLLAAAVDFLVDRVDEFTRDGQGKLDVRPLRRVVLTYPTMAPPGVRRRLREIAGALGLSAPDLRYDEAIAAALFFLMRDLGSDRTTGIEALRARFRRVVGRQGSWAENTLVIDVGGGTTDIALVGVRLDDRTPQLDGAQRPVAGRHYHLTPTLLGTTGKTRRGGDFLTLQTFHWIKATLADRLLSLDLESVSGSPHGPNWQNWQRTIIEGLDRRFRTTDTRNGYRPGSLSAEMLRDLCRDTTRVGDPDSREVRTNVERVLSTHWSGARDRTAFVRLWEMAEEAKKALGQKPTYQLPSTGPFAVTDVLSAALLHTMPQPPPISEPPVELDQETFAAICRPMLKEIATLAVGLARARIAAPGELDRVILTGKASRLPLLSKVVRDALDRATAEPGGRLLPDAARVEDAVTVEWAYAKTATSIGAAWAASKSASEGDGSARAAVARGESVVTIEVDNLFRNLPCAFARDSGDEQVPLLKAGAELLVTRDGRAVARARSGALTPDFKVKREVDPTYWKLWGSLHYEDLEASRRADAVGFAFDRTVWPRRIFTEVEVDSDLNLWLHLWCGPRPHYRFHPDDASLDLLPAGSSVEELRNAAEKLSFWVTADDPQQHVDARPVFDPVPAVTDTFVADDGTTYLVLVASELLPPAGSAGSWTFRLSMGYGERSGGMLVEDPAPDSGVRYRASLCADGQLRLHPAWPDYRIAATVEDVQGTPGAVLRRPLEGGLPDEYQPEPDDPFNGRQ